MVVLAQSVNMAHRYSKKNDCKSEDGGGSSNNGAQNADSIVQKVMKENEPGDIINQPVYKRMEQIVDRMQDEGSGVPVRTVKSFMTKIPSVFTGADLIIWMMKNLDVEDQAEALHLAHLMASHGYFFPIEDHNLTVKNDNTYYRFQTPCFWPSRCGEPENTDYAVYLCKRTMQNKQRLELADYEAENLARLQKMFSRKWELIFMQAEAQAKVDRKRDKLERKVLDSQERAFWDVFRPMPGSVNTTEVDIKKACKMNKPCRAIKPNYNVPGGRLSPSVSEADLRAGTEAAKKEIHEQLTRALAELTAGLERRRVKVSKVADGFINYFEQYAEFDPFVTPPEPTNPWLSDSCEFWEQERSMKEIPQRRVKRWAFSIHELLKDPAGRDQFTKFLDKEFSGENLKFWEACQELKCVPQKDVPKKVQDIYSAFLAPGAYDPVNVDSRVAEIVKKRVQNSPDQFCFDEAEEHIFNLMKCDSYTRYLRSDLYKEFLGGTKKKVTSLLSNSFKQILSSSRRSEST